MDDILDTLAELDDELEFDALLEEPIAALEVVDADGDMSEARAKEITEAIRSAATVTYILLAQAHAHNAHKALGYETWEEYVRAEFDMSPQRSYQLMDLSKVINAIEEATPEGTEVKITEAQARDIKRELPRVTEQIREAIEDGESAEDAVDRIIQDTREQKKADAKALAEKTQAAEESASDRESSRLESAADDFLEKNGGLDYSGDGDDGATGREEPADSASLSDVDSTNIYYFFNSMANIENLPEPDDFAAIIPKARREEASEQVAAIAAWFNRLQTLLDLEDF